MAGEDGNIGGGAEIGEDGDIMEAPGADLGGGGGGPPPPSLSSGSGIFWDNVLEWYMNLYEPKDSRR